MRITINRIAKALALCAGAFSCWTSTAALAARAPLSLPRDGKWVMDYDTDACQLAASFGTGKDAVTFVLRRFEPTDRFYLDLISQSISLAQPADKVTIDFGPVTNPRRLTPSLGTYNDGTAILGIGTDLLDREPAREGKTLPEITPEQEAAVTYVEVRQGVRQPLRLELGSMGAPMRAMRTCIDDLVRTWGFDPGALATLRSPPRPIGSPGDWLRASDYPDRLSLAGTQGMVQFRLDVDKSGTVAGCHIQGHTKPEEFNPLTCGLITSRAKFQPALDAAGKPVKWWYVNRVFWILTP